MLLAPPDEVLFFTASMSMVFSPFFSALRAAFCSERLGTGLNVARESRIELSKINQEITFSCENWNSGLASFESGEMSVVVVVDRYEGESAETIRNKLPDIIEKMQNTNAEATGVQGEIAEQISRLDEYIEKLEVKIGELRQQLAAL